MFETLGNDLPWFEEILKDHARNPLKGRRYAESEKELR